jgi:hypothetical protein
MDGGTAVARVAELGSTPEAMAGWGLLLPESLSGWYAYNEASPLCA